MRTSIVNAWALLTLVFAFASACASNNNASQSGGGACDSRRNSAVAEVGAVVEANQACERDADCQTIAFQSDCFDACTRAVSVAGVDAVNAAIARVNAGTCTSFKSDGCRVEIPPCVPPADPKCVAGSCQ